ncbi:GntR family transcriptional regulator [Nonomuraea typhae]|uniref:GntR family transcriptional regulator n=1 Tax=Nonomuraea typhae TaxID=2603600 RepID=UPI001C681FE3|nr:winged helix-turn-helix domain-containing protein [Nonomuraea typhae]
MIVWKPSIPRWKQLHEILAERIETGEYPPGERMPSITALMNEFGLAVATTQKAVAKLREDGLIYTEPGLGSFVAEQGRESPDPS